MSRVRALIGFRRFRIGLGVLGAVGIASAGVLMWAFSSGFAGDFERSVLSDLSPFGERRPLSISRPYDDAPGWTASLEQKVVGSDVIARARFVSATRSSINIVTTYGGILNEPVSYHIAAMELRFEILEHLKGSGPSEVVAIVWEDFAERFQTAQGARLFGTNIVAARNATWDSREAIVFLTDIPSNVPSLRSRADYYTLGRHTSYAIDTLGGRRWLPDADAGSTTGSQARSSRADAQRFLLEAPAQSDSSVTRSSSSQATGTTPTITLGTLKQKITEMQAEVDEGDGTEAYRNCVYLKYARASYVAYVKENNDGQFHQGQDFAEIASGMASGTEVAEDYEASSTLSAFGPIQPPELPTGVFQLFGRDVGLFDYRYPGFVYLERPLPDGEYRVFWGGVLPEYLPCDALPQEEKERHELVVTVTAPAGTLHEAFFDPVDLSGSRVGATGSSGVIDPDEFTVAGDDYEIESLVWRSNSVVLTLDDHVSLSGQTLDFIELDGSIDTSLDIADATVNQTAATWTWSVDSQSWEDGDLLMVRIRETG